jgi:acetoin utilization deacetylase AcuC-like enzyme
MSFCLVSSPRFADHLTPPGHPERAARAEVMQAVAAKWAALGVPVLAPRPATREELLRIHTPEYLDLIAAMAGGAMMLDEDTFTSPDTVEVAALAAGAAIVAVDTVLAPPTFRPSDLRGSVIGPSDLRASLALVRPPGHHAKPGRAMGFCIYNNVAIAAAHALGRGLTRVAIVDYDVHHGNGTQWSFYDDPRVLTISTHQFPFYPGSGAADEVGEGRGAGFTLNAPLEASATDGDYRMVFECLVLPALEAFRPELLLVSAGFDAHMRDPIAQMAMSVAGCTALARMLRDFGGGRRCPLVFVTEGGYHLQAVRACLDALVAVLGEAEDGTEVLSRDSEGLRRDSGVLSRDSEGLRRDSEGLRRDSEGLRRDSEGVRRDSEGLRRDSEGLSRDSGDARRGGDDGERAESLSPDEAPLVEHETAEPTHRGPAAVDLIRSVQKPYWPTL